MDWIIKSLISAAYLKKEQYVVNFWKTVAEVPANQEYLDHRGARKGTSTNLIAKHVQIYAETKEEYHVELL